MTDLNCDLGEGESSARTRALARWVTSVNIACGGHAGDAGSMERCVVMAQKLGVRIGAHPGVPGEGGRGAVEITASGLRTLVLQQVGALHRLTEVHRIRLHHVKLHGSLYHAVERDPALARAYVGTIARWFGGTRIYAACGGRVAEAGARAGMAVWEEAFADRGYAEDGSLVPRGMPGAMIMGVSEVAARAKSIAEGRGVTTVAGTVLPLRPRTLCVHGDTQGSVGLVRAVNRALADSLG